MCFHNSICGKKKRVILRWGGTQDGSAATLKLLGAAKSGGMAPSSQKYGSPVDICSIWWPEPWKLPWEASLNMHIINAQTMQRLVGANMPLSRSEAFKRSRMWRRKCALARRIKNLQQCDSLDCANLLWSVSETVFRNKVRCWKTRHVWTANKYISENEIFTIMPWNIAFYSFDTVTCTCSWSSHTHHESPASALKPTTAKLKTDIGVIQADRSRTNKGMPQASKVQQLKY